MKSKYMGIGIIILIFGVVVLSGCTQTQENTSQQNTSGQNTSNTVTMQNFAFNPNTITVPVGTTVTWINQDSAGHDVTSDTGAFKSEILNKGESYNFTFTHAGTYSYSCTPHPSMKGTVIVQG